MTKQDLLTQIVKCAAYSDGWRGYGSKAATFAAIKDACDFIDGLADEECDTEVVNINPSFQGEIHVVMVGDNHRCFWRHTTTDDTAKRDVLAKSLPALLEWIAISDDPGVIIRAIKATDELFNALTEDAALTLLAGTILPQERR